MTVKPHVLRRYVIEKASGRTPRPEWAYYAPDLDAWIRTDETSARCHEHHRRIRVGGREWCEILGHQTDVRDDFALQVYFLTLSGDDWPCFAAAVRESPGRCLREWTAAGTHIIATVMFDETSDSSGIRGQLTEWPDTRGTGRRSLLRI